MSAKILHLTDLHICHKDVRAKLEPLTEKISSILLGFGFQSFHFGYHEELLLDSVKRIVKDENPDIILVTGDITTFGDKSSFLEACRFLLELRDIGRPKSQSLRKIHCVPGNHDGLCSLLGSLTKSYFKVGWLVGRALRTFSRNERLKNFVKAYQELPELIKILEPILEDEEKVNANPKEPFANYDQFVKNLGGGHSGEVIPTLIDGTRIVISPFDSASTDKWFINAGDTGKKRYQAFKKSMDEHDSTVDDIKIVLVHHNPISAPNQSVDKLENAMNAMPSASQFIYDMQEQGVDLILFGHQHEFNCCQIDFVPSKPGHLYLVGAKSSLSGQNVGLNVIEIESRYHGKLRGYEIISDTGTSRIGKEIDLIFENERTKGAQTLSARREIRKYTSDGHDSDWEEIANCRSGELLLVGPRQHEILEESSGVRKSIINRLKSGFQVKILLSDPELYDIISDEIGLPEDRLKKLNSIWSNTGKYDWSDLAETVRRVENDLRDLAKRYDPNGEILFVRFSHTLMPIGARCINFNLNPPPASIPENANSEKKIVLRLLGVGRFNDSDRPTILLRKRHERALYGFYEDYITQLWDSASPVVLD